MTATLLRLEPTMTVTPLPAGPVNITFPREPKHVADARLWTVSTFLGWGVPAPVIDTAELLVSEAVTNAIKARGDGPTTISAEYADGLVRISVTDPDPYIPAAAELPGDDAESGRGLPMIGILAAKYDFEPADDGKVLWFEIEAA